MLSFTGVFRLISSDNIYKLRKNQIYNRENSNFVFEKDEHWASKDKIYNRLFLLENLKNKVFHNEGQSRYIIHVPANEHFLFFVNHESVRSVIRRIASVRLGLLLTKSIPARVFE